LVRFSYQGGAVSGVAVAGDFTGWRPVPLVKVNGSWSGLVPVPLGLSRYQFVVDRDRWLPDPAAARVPEDDFGGEVSLIWVL
jgi:1,4-alpha-glucan branching enzyme